VIGGLLAKLFSGGIVDIAQGVGNVVDQFVHTDEEKAKAKLALEQVITERMQTLEESARTTVEARMEVTVAEINSGDQYVRRTRPMLARWGLYIIVFNYCVVPLAQQLAGYTVAAFEMPMYFWAAWGGIVGTWQIGRSFERVSGTSTGLSRLLTGSPASS
jgi:hypothetical protein